MLPATAFDFAPFSRNGCLQPIYTTALGSLLKGDSLKILPTIASECIDTIFADPPFNIGKEYGESVNDHRSEQEYLEWCHVWIDDSIRILKQGGSFFLYNIPKWNFRLANFLIDRGMHFRHWIVVDMKCGLPISGRLYPSHYSLLYFTKGKHRSFHNIRTPIRICRHCGKEIKDYGGHRGAMNPKGVNLTDVWDDISPVRHRKFKSRKRKANALSTIILDRVVEMSTEVGDVLLDPFGGSGTTFVVCEKKGRRWIGIEIESTDVIIDRLRSEDLAHYKNDDFVES
jgi:site-specific DNA-methyltransferase (adenine-specific)